ncbi:MAG: hypothetical protein QG605_1183, partial [Euryarchaeota archaeon]|nr:hypothetical protein [Euryarchaeota archaeon]
SQVHNRKLALFPKCNVICNLLYDLGLYPYVEVLYVTSFPKEYADYGKALFYLKSTLNIFDETHDELLHNYIEDHWRRGDGRLFMDDKTTYVKLSWMPKDMDLEMKL